MTFHDRPGLPDIWKTTTFRLALLFGLLSCVGVMVLAGVIYAMTARVLTARSDGILHQEARSLRAVSPQDLPGQIETRIVRDYRGLDHFALISADGETIAGDLGFTLKLTADHPVDVEANAVHGPMRVLAIQVAGGNTVLIGRDISEIRYLLRRILEITVGSTITIVAAMLAVGTGLSLGPIKRVRSLRLVSEQIASGQLDVRMPLTRRDDELDKIAVMVNAMINDLARVVSQVKHVTDAIAHDLRTPLTRMRTHLDLMRSLPDLPEGLSQRADQLVQDLDLVLERFAALLRISELEAGERRAGFGPVDLTSLVRALQELYGPVADEAGVFLIAELDARLWIHADRDLLFEAVGNLIDNAIKFGHRRVIISATRESGVARLAVRDDGAGIPAAEKEAVLRRFYRRADDKDRAGAGLGLSIVAAILHLHRFRLDLADGHPGLVASILIDPSHVIEVWNINENSLP